MARLLITVPGEPEAQKVRLKRQAVVWIGSDPACDVVVRAEDVAPRHFRIEYHKRRYLLVREPKVPAVYVRGEKIRRVMLRDGERVTFGRAVAVFRDRSAPKAETLKDKARQSSRSRRRRQQTPRDEPAQPESPAPRSDGHALHDDRDDINAFDNSQMSWHDAVRNQVHEQRRAASRRLRRARRSSARAAPVTVPSRWRGLPVRLALGTIALAAAVGLLLLYQNMRSWPHRYHRSATEALSNGQLDVAARLWSEMVAGAPDHALAGDARRGLSLLELIRALRDVQPDAKAPDRIGVTFLGNAHAFVTRADRFLRRYGRTRAWRPWAHKLSNGLADVARACQVAAAESRSPETVDLGLRALRAAHQVDLLSGDAAPGSSPKPALWARLRRLRGETRFAARLASLNQRIPLLAQQDQIGQTLTLLHELVVAFPDQADRPAITRLSRQVRDAVRRAIRFQVHEGGLQPAPAGPGRRHAPGPPCPDDRAATVQIGRSCHTYDIKDGRLVWQCRLTASPAGPPVWVGDGDAPLLALPGGDQRLWLMRPGSGEPLGAAVVDGAICGHMLAAGTRLWVPVKRGLWEWDVSAKRWRGLWRLPVPGPFRLRLDPTGKRLVVAAHAFAVCVLDVAHHTAAGVVLTLHRPGSVRAAPWIDRHGLVVFENRGLAHCRVRMTGPSLDPLAAPGQPDPVLDGWVWHLGRPLGSTLPIVTDRGIVYGLDLAKRTRAGAAAAAFRQDLERFDKPRYAQVPRTQACGADATWVSFAGLRPVGPGKAPGSLQVGLVVLGQSAAGPPVAHAGTAPMFVVLPLPAAVPRLVRLAPERHDVAWSVPIPLDANK